MGGPSFGEKNGAAKLTSKQADEIRNSREGYRTLARRFCVDHKQIQRIKKGRSWISAATPQAQGE
jgi:hypothetical protein